jgi:muramoyltetrapeptide carboxypeptidase
MLRKLEIGDSIGIFSPSTIGGMNSNSILPYIDYDSFRKDPKIIIGYSDVTAILFGIYAMTGISTFFWRR